MISKAWVNSAVCLLAISALGLSNGAEWFVDKHASGSASGRDWSNAWTTCGQIAWPSVAAGDTIYLSAGVYPEYLPIEKSGSSNAPITIRVGKEPGHNGKVRLRGINFRANHWITINGALLDAYVAPTNIANLRSITNNIGILCNNDNGPGMYMTSPTGIKLYWVGVERARRGTGKTEAHGILANVTRREVTDHNVFKYCWINNVEDDGIAWIASSGVTHFSHQEVAYSVIENVGDDGIEANPGFTVHDCIIGPSLFLQGHPDGIQSVGSYWKIYNNEFHDFFNSWLRLQAVETNHHDVWVYNNLFLSGRFGDPKVSIYNTGIEVVQYAASLGELDSMTWNRILFCNNTFYGGKRLVGGAINWAKRDEGTKDAFVHNVTVTNSLFVNNIVMDCANGVAAWRQELKTAPPWGNHVYYADEQSLRWDYNTVAGFDAPQSRRVGYFGVLYPVGEAMARSSVWKHNSSRVVRFVDAKNWNFELDASDVSARDQADDLSIYFNYDILNRPRNGLWDRGAYETP